ncbi:fasciclin domain-containing protein [Aquimarina sp. ERC-38]|uniref:fasciclin domain-containing protein n=1 Tax=Aquimarina sp. ERC-38 TaxID=2949996 RepID=UPI002247BD0B|nr:fasciclin domain-containing protein [Aquimarina sp. ERC-38]UZO80474.1 fasciclin domain-containing protein [Aquimarina sp. ERC-38]
MISFSKYRIIALLTVLLFGFYACSDDDDNNTNRANTDFTLAALAADDPELTDLVAALQATELVDLLNGTTSYTLLAPTNAAFDTFFTNNDIYNQISDVPVALLTQIILYHVIDGNLLAEQFTDTGYENTIAPSESEVLNDTINNRGLSIYYNATNGLKFNNETTVVTSDVTAANGTLHKVDRLLSLPTLTSTLQVNPDLVTLLNRLKTTGLIDTLSNAKDFTLLAPTNQAFEIAGSTGMDPLEALLKNHVVDSILTATAIIQKGNGYTQTLSQLTPKDNVFLSLYHNTNSGVRFNGKATVTTPDIVTPNGLIHIIDAVITLPAITDFITADPDFTTLFIALTDDTPGTDFTAIFSRTNVDNPDGFNAPFTLFAPVEAAFATFGPVPEEAILTPILLGHTLSGANICSDDLMDGTLTTLNGDITVAASERTLGSPGNDSLVSILSTDIQAVNGIIHKIDNVLLQE